MKVLTLAVLIGGVLFGFVVCSMDRDALDFSGRVSRQEADRFDLGNRLLAGKLPSFPQSRLVQQEHSKCEGAYEHERAEACFLHSRYETTVPLIAVRDFYDEWFASKGWSLNTDFESSRSYDNSSFYVTLDLWVPIGSCVSAFDDSEYNACVQPIIRRDDGAVHTYALWIGPSTTPRLPVLVIWAGVASLFISLGVLALWGGIWVVLALVGLVTGAGRKTSQTTETMR